MKPVKFEGCNITFAENQPEYTPLPAFIDADGTITTEWDLAPSERQAIAQGKNLRLSVMTFNHPLQPILPYIQDVAEGPATIEPSAPVVAAESPSKSKKILGYILISFLILCGLGVNVLNFISLGWPYYGILMGILTLVYLYVTAVVWCFSPSKRKT